MTDYKNIRGKKIKFLTSDLGNAQAEGQIFYSGIPATASAAGAFNFKTAISSAAFSASASLSTGRSAFHQGAAGTQTAGLVFGGDVPPDSNATEEYNGSGWAVGGNLGTARRSLAGAGTQTAGLAFGGTGPAKDDETEEYNGSSWSEQDDLNTARRDLGGAGTQTAALAFGGEAGPGRVAIAEAYDGSSWTEGPDLNTARNNNGGTGTQTAALSFGGVVPGPAKSNATEEYDGSSWTNSNNMNNARSELGSAGIQTAGLAIGGEEPPGGVTRLETYDGSTWSTSPATLSTARVGAAATGSSTAAFIAGGSGSPKITATEEFNVAVMSVVQGAWSSGATLNTGRKRASGAGTQTAAMMAGGFTSPPNAQRAEVEEYNGTAWSEVNNIPAVKSFMGYGGTQTAAVSFGGTSPVVATTLEYDGTNWTSGGDLGTARYRIGGAGTQTAALGFGGYTGSPPNVNVHTEEYDGSSWTDGGDLSTARSYLLSCSGIQTDAMCINGGSPYTDSTEIYNGSAWTAGSDTLYGNRGYVASAGTSTSALRLFTAGIASPSPRKSAESQTYDGSAFSTAPSLATARHSVSSAAAATSATAMAYGGEIVTGNSDLTEEFTGETTALNLKIITDS
jgi:hypothetical protein